MADRGRRHRGFSLLELVVVLCIIGLLVGFAARRLLALRVEAERAAMSQLLGGLEAAISLELLTRITRTQDRELASLAGSNPMALLVTPPHTYVGEFDVGEFDRPASETIAKGRWYFDRSRGWLVYRARYPDRFESELPGPAAAAFRVEMVWDDRDGDGRFDPGVDGIGGARLASVAPWSWK